MNVKPRIIDFWKMEQYNQNKYNDNKSRSVDYISENHFSVKGKTMIKTVVQWIINLIGYALVFITVCAIIGPIAMMIVVAIKSSGALNVNSWNPEQRTHYEKVFKITIPESVEWVQFREWHGFRDTIFRGELYATPEEFAQLFPPERFPLEDLPADEALSYVKDCDIDYKDDMLRPDCSYKKYESPYSKSNFNNWEIVVEFPPDEKERIHVWFVKF